MRASRMLIPMMGMLLGGMPAMAATPEHPEEAPHICPICHRANDPHATYTQKAAGTFMRGATNAMFGWTELLTEPNQEVKAGGNLVAGVGKGVGFAVKRTVLGFGELFTFWTPKGKKGYIKFSDDCPICMGKRDVVR